MDNNVLLDTIYEATDGDYAIIVFPASQVPEDVLEKMDKINRIYLPNSVPNLEKMDTVDEKIYLPDHVSRDVNNEGLNEVSQNYPKDIDSGELSRISQNYVDAMIEMINLKADLEREMVYCTAAYTKVMCEIVENKGI
jgi:hypothetical protein